MADDRSELIVMLCTQIGMIMEDASVSALTIRSMSGYNQIARILEIKRASNLCDAGCRG